MTREEALKKCLNILEGKPIRVRSGDIPINQLLNMLEALELIKFENIPSISIDNSPFYDIFKIDNALKLIGYKIVKIDA